MRRKGHADKLLMEELHGRDCHQRHVVRLARRNGSLCQLCAQAFRFPRIEHADGIDGIRLQHLTRPRRSIGPRERFRYRRAIRSFRSLEHAGGNERGRDVLQHVFLVEHAQLDVVGQPRRKLGETVIQERKPPLNRVAHEHPVALRRQQVAREQRVRLQELRAGEGAPLRELRRSCCEERLHRVVPEHTLGEGGREETPDPRRRRPAEQVRKARLLRVIEAQPPECFQQRRILLPDPKIRVQALQQQIAPIRSRPLSRPMPYLALPVQLVAPEELVGALSGQHHFRAVIAYDATEREQRRRR